MCSREAFKSPGKAESRRSPEPANTEAPLTGADGRRPLGLGTRRAGEGTRWLVPRPRPRRGSGVRMWTTTPWHLWQKNPRHSKFQNSPGACVCGPACHSHAFSRGLLCPHDPVPLGTVACWAPCGSPGTRGVLGEPSPTTVPVTDSPVQRVLGARRSPRRCVLTDASDP